MNKLEKLYDIIQSSKEIGLELGPDVLKQVDELEEQIIKKEILPALSKDIAPRLEPIKRDLVLVVEYHPYEPIKVALSRRAKISEINDAKTLTPKINTPVSSGISVIPPPQPTESRKWTRTPTQGLKVTFPDGTVICRRTAIDTFIAALDKIGFAKVHALGIVHSGYNLVSRQQRPTTPGIVWQHECKGWFVYSNIGNEAKVEDLQKLSDKYNLDLKISEGKSH